MRGSKRYVTKEDLAANLSRRSITVGDVRGIDLKSRGIRLEMGELNTHDDMTACVIPHEIINAIGVLSSEDKIRLLEWIFPKEETQF
jgi:hypothetical protein